MATHLIVIFIHVYKVSVLVVIMSHDLKTEDMVGYEISYVINATIGILRGKELVHCSLLRFIFGYRTPALTPHFSAVAQTDQPIRPSRA